jgi:VanZ family protein
MSLLSKIKSPRLWQFVLVCYWLALFVSTHVPSEVLYVPGNTSDKFIHVVAYAALAVLAAMAWHLAFGRPKARHLCFIWVTLVVYGAIDEWTQIPVGRDASVRDWFADASGAAIGLAAFALLVRFALKPETEPALQ